ncbi:MAG: excinuclease ABC subunit UvrA [Hyphomicrobiaceae bacterium]|nr:excinuclease ABC subunit UvrA [Hyphomicrobiaceae bacterium]
MSKRAPESTPPESFGAPTAAHPQPTRAPSPAHQKPAPRAHTIHVRGAREHNLKNVDLEIPRDALIVFTGLSGSGKSSLAFDTIYAEGQRRYVESLSAYARQFLEMMQKPDVDHIDGLSPAISIEQKTTSKNPRSTVGTVTEIYDYLRLLFARVGVPYSPATGLPIESQTVSQMVDKVLALPEGTRLMLMAPVVRDRKGEFRKELAEWQKKGFQRVKIDGTIYEIQSAPKLDKKYKHDIEVVVDRIVVRPDIASRLADSFETALALADGIAIVELVDKPLASPSPRPSRGEGRGVGQQQGSEQASQPPRPSLLPKGRGDAQAARHGTTSASRHEDRPTDASPGEPVAPPSPLGERVGVRGSAAGAEKEVLRNKNDTHERIVFSQRFACPVSGFTIEEIEPRIFSFNAPAGACPKCDGLGTELRFEPDLVVPDRSLSLEDGAIWPWARTGNTSPYYEQTLQAIARHYKVSMAAPFEKLPKRVQDVILFGSDGEEIEFAYEDGLRTYRTTKAFEGVIGNIERRWRETDSEWVREELSRYQGAHPCEACSGYRLKPQSLAVKIGGRHIGEVADLAIRAANDWFRDVPATFTQQQGEIAGRILKEIRERLQFLVDVGLDYLTLSRAAGTLSGGESQRIRLASQIGSGLTGVLYVLDEPSIGLHQRDNARLLVTLRHLRDLGNTVLVVEHDEDAILTADYVVDIGPGAGVHGGRIVAQGTPAEVMANPNSLTGEYLTGKRQVPVPKVRRQPDQGRVLKVVGARENNLQNVTAEIPLGVLTCVTGVSGGGKSTFLIDTVYKAVARKLNGAREAPGRHERIEGLEHLDKVIDIDQSPIGRTPRSNPATYTGAFTPIRDWFAGLPLAKTRGYGPGRFSFNVKGGRCEACQGDGVIKIEMHFLPDVYVTCDQCKGKRYNRETLEVLFREKSIADVLDMTVEEGVTFFAAVPSIRDKLETLHRVGLGYIKIGQQATTLSGGEAQRIKLAKELSRRATGRTLYILDEPTTGLHFHDVAKLLEVLHELADAGNTMVVIEHNLEVIKTADWIIDMGPEGGDGGGRVVAEGTPEQVAEVAESYTGQFLKELLARRAGGAAGAADAKAHAPRTGAKRRNGSKREGREAAE